MANLFEGSPEVATAGSTYTFCFTDASRANTTVSVDVVVSGEVVDTVSVELDAEGNGTGDVSVGSEWAAFVLEEEGSEDWAVTVDSEGP